MYSHVHVPMCPHEHTTLRYGVLHRKVSRVSPRAPMSGHMHDHKCVHDEMVARSAPFIVPQLVGKRRGRNLATAGLRVRFWNETLDGDARTCYSVGEVVAIGESKSVACSATVHTDCDHTCNPDTVLSAAKHSALARLLPALSGWLAEAFAMHSPVTGALRIADRTCGFGGVVTMPSALLRDGSAATDVLILVTARPIPSSTLAFAGHCQEDAGTAPPEAALYVPRRPTVGHINIDPASIGTLEYPGGSESAERVLKVLLHETLHVLGFSQGKMAELPCPSAPAFNRHQARTYELRPCADANSTEPVVVGRGGAQLLATPHVVEQARRHFDCRFGCGSLDGVPLEDCRGGDDCTVGSGTAASHWEKRVMLGDVMVGSSAPTEGQTVSNMTLAYFLDAGWYEPNYAVGPLICHYAPEINGCAGAPADDGIDGGEEVDGLPKPVGAAIVRWREPQVWGRGRGCDFVSERCDGDAWRATGYFCAEPLSDDPAAAIDRDGCTAGRIAVGHCTLTRHAAAVPDDFRYFPGHPQLGGRPMDDYCPLVAPYTGWDCRVAPESTSRQAGIVARASMEHGEARCATCRCFASNLYNATNAVASAYHGCYPHRCLSPVRLQLHVAGEWRDCRAHNHSIVLAGWTGTLSCPPAHELCASSEDQQYPEITSVRPLRGPVAGGTPITVRGVHLGSLARPPRGLLICGAEAVDVRVHIERNGTASGVEHPANRTTNHTVESLPNITSYSKADSKANFTANVTGLMVGPPNSPPQALPPPLMPSSACDASDVVDASEDGGSIDGSVVLAVTAPLPPKKRVAELTACSLELRSADGRSALMRLAFTYEGPPLPSCQVFDFDDFELAELTIERATALYICVWPYVLAAIVAFGVLRCAWNSYWQSRELSHAKALRRRRVMRLREDAL